MPETTNIDFEFKEIAELLVRKSNLHEGIWGIEIRFGIGGTNIGIASGDDLTPAAIVPILKIGLQRFKEPNNLTVDAGKINPGEEVD